ncbi:MAG TPA: DUF421 domain-containing protein [Candidatus Anaerofilum faecale]|nr:DUF421 domain-containing protein [Anaerofilum sp. An201]OUP01890.1 hypothetical protein B5F36_11840 [Anaerofilum sp. An201]HIX13160.1 DUF421 domain-containing protein [Candidatus Anaerofilum faecale]
MAVILLRTILVYCMVIAAMRLMGKRQLGELQPSELVSTILLSNLASISIESPELPLMASALPVLLIVCFEILLSALCVRSRRAARLISGQPVVIIRDGHIDQAALRSLRFTMDDVLEALRAKDIFDPAEVTCAMVETNGSVSIYRAWEQDTPTRQDLGLKPDSDAQKPQMPFVIDGEIMEDNLIWCGKNPDWLKGILAQNRLGLSDTLLLAGDDTEQYTLVRKDSRT